MSHCPPLFRETLWFKKGELDAEEAAAAAAGDDDLAPAAVDLLPVADRYRDDGTLGPEDTASFGLHTGSTTMLAALAAPPPPAGASAMSESDLARELRRSSLPYAVLLVAGLAALAAVIVLFGW